MNQISKKVGKNTLTFLLRVLSLEIIEVQKRLFENKKIIKLNQ